MELKADVVVVGSGLAGACAALAAREEGADVLVVARAPGASALSSGAIDLAYHRGDVSLAEAARELARRPGHPYALLRGRLVPAIDRSLALLRRHLAPLGLEGARTSADRNLWLATPLGRAKPAALAQGPIAAGDLRPLSPQKARVGVVALAGAQVVEAGLIVQGLAQLLAPLATAVLVPLDLYRQRTDPLRTLMELAQDLDRPGRRAALAESLGRAASAARASHLLLPTLGLEDPLGARAELERALGLPVFESLGAPPSVPGLRLQRALAGALDRAGVRRFEGIAERGAEGELQIVRGVECVRVRAGAVVLASGRYLGGGIRCEPQDGRLFETVLDLPATAAGRRAIVALPNEELFAQRAAGPHPGLAAGIWADAEFRALDDRGLPAVAGGAAVFAAGAVLGGFDPACDEGGLGVCAVTGLAAGEAAARAAGRAGMSAKAEAAR